MAPVISDYDSETPQQSELPSEVDLEDEEEVDLEDSDLEKDLDDFDEDDDIAGVSEEEENYRLEDPDEIDDNLDLEEEDQEPAPRKPTRQPARESRKRTINYFEADPTEFDEVEPLEKKSKKSSSTLREDVQRPEDLDPDLILTDEETEYNPANHTLRLTERQRKIEFGELEIKESKKKPAKKETEEEAALRKAESARRRLDYKNKQLEEEKRDTLNKLLKRRANKVRDVKDTDSKDDTKALKPRRPEMRHPALVRYLTNTRELNGNATLSYN